MNVAEDELQERIERKRKRLDLASEDLKEDVVVPDQVPSTFYDMALHARGIGIGYVLLSEKEKSLEWFGKAADYYLKCQEKAEELKDIVEKSWQENKPLRLVDALHMAVLSKNQDRSGEIANRILDIDENYLDEIDGTEDWYYYAKCTAAAVLDQEHLMEEHSRKLDGVADKTGSREEYLPLFVAGLSDSDRQRAENAIQGLLEDHRDRINGGRLSDDELISIEASVWYLLAEGRGLELSVDSKYIPGLLK